MLLGTGNGATGPVVERDEYCFYILLIAPKSAKMQTPEFFSQNFVSHKKTSLHKCTI